MKKIKNVVLILALFMCFNQCERNQPDEASPANGDELTIEQAKAFVEMQKMSTFSIKSGSIEKHRINIRANWNKAKSSNNQDVSVVETEIEALGSFGFATSESIDAWKSTQKDNYLCPTSRLVVIRLKKTHEEYSFIMTFVGDKQYLESKNFKLSDNTYLNRQNDFTGYVLYHSLTGEFVNGWIYCDGKITNKISQPENLDLPVDLKSAQVMLSLYSWETDCTVWFTQDGDYVHYDYQVCQGVISFPSSFETGTSGGSSNDAATGAVSGGTTGGYTPPLICNCSSRCPICGKCSTSSLKSASLPTDGTGTTSDPCTYCDGKHLELLQSTLRTLFPNGVTNLSAGDITNLNNAFNEMNKKCIYSFINDQLVSNNVTLGSIMIEFGEAARVTSLGNLKFCYSSDITAESLEHEWIHLYQRFISKVDLFNTANKGMCEFERQLMGDIKEFVRIAGIESFSYNYNWACYNMGNDDHKIEYITWLNQLTSNGTSYPSSIDDVKFRYFANIFGDVFLAYNKSKGYDYTNPAYRPVSASQLFSHCTGSY